MNHLDDLETVELPGEFARALLAGATSEAVIVQSDAPEAPASSEESGGPPDRKNERIGRRDRVVLFRVGRVLVAEAVTGDGSTRHLGLAPAEGETYVERVDHDEEWTLLWIAGALAADRGEADGTEAAVGP